MLTEQRPSPTSSRARATRPAHPGLYRRDATRSPRRHARRRGRIRKEKHALSRVVVVAPPTRPRGRGGTFGALPAARLLRRPRTALPRVGASPSTSNRPSPSDKPPFRASGDPEEQRPLPSALVANRAQGASSAPSRPREERALRAGRVLSLSPRVMAGHSGRPSTPDGGHAGGASGSRPDPLFAEEARREGTRAAKYLRRVLLARDSNSIAGYRGTPPPPEDEWITWRDRMEGVSRADALACADSSTRDGNPRGRDAQSSGQFWTPSATPRCGTRTALV
jgi:hypothetical protein